MLIEIIIFLVTFTTAYYVYVHKRIHYHFDKNGVKYIPGWPILGNVVASTFLKKHIIEDIDTVYKAFPGEKYVGYIEGTSSIIIIRDPELIKNITVKDFDHFVNHKEFFSEEVEPLFGGSLLMMKDDKWRDMRTTLSPAFTGSKMRLMVPFMVEISNNIVHHLRDHLSENIDIDELMRRYTNDVIASAGFGLQVNSLKDKDNEFYKMGQELFNFTGWRRCCFVIAVQFPQIAKKLGIPLFPKKTTQFFRNVVSSTMEYRTKNNVERPDMIQLLMEASKGTLKNTNDTAGKDSVGFATVNEVLKPRDNARKWTQNELASQVFIFFVAGFESSANGLVMCIHELAINPEVQDKLYQEIKAFKERKGNISYDNIGDLKYLDCVLSETSRKWAAAIIMDRVCTKSYDLPPAREGGKPYKLKPGDIVYNLVNSLHMDPLHFPEPATFNPDRFSDENKHNIKPFTYMPFGMGPRNCIGSRFALLELKIMIYSLVLNYEIVKCEKTMDPIRLRPTDFNIKAADGTWVKLLARH